MFSSVTSILFQYMNIIIYNYVCLHMYMYIFIYMIYIMHTMSRDYSVVKFWF